MLVSVEYGRLIASGSLRGLSLSVIALAVVVAARLEPRQILWVTLAFVPLPLYMQGLHASLTVGLVAGLWISILGAYSRGAIAAANRTVSYWPLLAAVLVTSLLAFWWSETTRLGADVAAFGRIVLGVALFGACLVLVRNERDAQNAFAALGAGGLIVFAVTLMQLFLPSLLIPGLLTNVGSVQDQLYGVTRNLRVGGPIGDYDLISEYYGLLGSAAVFWAMRTRGRIRLLWIALVPIAISAIGMSSTRSGFAIFALGALGALFLAPSHLRLRASIALGTACAAVIPLFEFLQRRLDTGFLFRRIATSQTNGGFMAILDRASVWPYFLDNVPTGPALFFGRGVAYDYGKFETYPHSLPLTLVFTVGLFGLAAFYALLGTIIVRCVRAARRAASPAAAVSALLVALFVLNEVKIEYVREYNYQWFVWSLLGLAAAASRGERRHE